MRRGEQNHQDCEMDGWNSETTTNVYISRKMPNGTDIGDIACIQESNCFRMRTNMLGWLSSQSTGRVGVIMTDREIAADVGL